MAHELAHNILGHRAQLDAAGVSRGLLAPFGKNRTRIRATELEADRHALYLMARAGYDIAVAPAFWERFGRKVDAGILSDGTHAGWRERVQRAREEITRIEAQRRAGQLPTP
jgi:beta-barrel assembly-enhancing protease